MKDSNIESLQNKFRGAVSAFRSHRFVEHRTMTPAGRFRSAIRVLFLLARAELQPNQFTAFLNWVRKQSKSQIPMLETAAIGHEELSGVFTDAPEVPLETEVQWIVERLAADHQKINDFRRRAEEVESLAFSNLFEDAIVKVCEIEDQFGVSFWSVQLRVALETQAGGLERQKRYTAEVRKIYKGGLLSFITYQTSVRNEERTSIAKYLVDVKSRIERHKYYEPFVKTYLRHKLALEWPSTSSGLADILRVEQSHSLIDLYETFVAVLREIVQNHTNSESLDLLAKALPRLSEIEDFRLSQISRRSNIKGYPNEMPARDEEISDLILSGQPHRAIRSMRRSTPRRAVIDPWQLIYAGITYAHFKPHSGEQQHLLGDVPKLIGRVLSGRDKTDSFAQLWKVVKNFHGLVAASGILELLAHIKRDAPDSPWRPWNIGLFSPTTGTEDIVPMVLLDKTASTQSSNYVPLSPTQAAWRYVHAPISNSDIAINVIHGTFCATGLVIASDHESASSRLDAISPSLAAPLSFFVSMLALNVDYVLGKRGQVIKLIACEGTKGAELLDLLPVLPALYNYQWDNFKSIAEPLVAPIALHMLWIKSEKALVLTWLRFATASFLRSAQVSRPRELFDQAHIYPQHQLIYFLRHICVPDILDSSRVLKGTNAILEERQAICADLIELDEANAEAYGLEVVGISNQLALAAGKLIVDRTRIHVDSDALHRWALKELSEDYDRYRDLLDVSVTEQQDFDEIINEMMGDANPTQNTFSPKDEADTVLFGVMQKLSNEFLTNSNFGLDFYLSKRIRHQSFTGLIRGPLEFSNLITTRESETAKYHPNAFWLDKFKTLDDASEDNLNEVFSRFSTAFDDILLDAKDKRFHIASTEHPAGLISLDLTMNLLILTRTIARMDTTMHAFLQTAIAILWSSLESSLGNVRAFINESLKQKVADCFDQLKARVRVIAEHDPALLVFDVEVNQRSTEVQRALDDAASWFVRADLEAQKQHFKLPQVVSVAVDSALKCLRAFSPEITTTTVGDETLLLGTSLIFVHDVVFVALDNVRAHSGLKRPRVKVHAEADKNNGVLIISVRSDFKSENRAANEKKLNEIKDHIQAGTVGKKVQREGGSGFYKLSATVKQSKKGSLAFGFDEKGEFQIKVTYSLTVKSQSLAEVAEEEYANTSG